MAEFQYQGVDKAGKKVEGKLEASAEGECRMLLRGMGLRPTRIFKSGALNRDLGAMMKMGGSGRVPTTAVVQFTRQLGVLISSGVPLVQALEILAEQTSHPTLRSAAIAIREKVSGGSYFWEAVAGYPQIFPKLYVSLIRAGEASGAMDQMLKRLTRYLEDADHLRKLLKSAMMYPIIVISIAVGVIALMMVFVIPKFEELLKGSGQALPGPTQFVIDLSHFISGNILYLIVGGGVMGFLLARYLRTPEGKAFVDRAAFRLPMFGALAQKAGVAKFSRTLHTLLASGVNLIDAIDICKATIDNAVLEDAVSKVRADVETGKTLGGVLARLTVFPKMATQMISVGESTGALDKMLEKVADFYEDEVETMVGGLTKLIEPILLVFLGTMVGGLMIAMYLPIFKMAGGAE